MNKQALTAALSEHYGAFVQYINSLSDADYNYRYEQKWTAAEQLVHIVLCVQPLVQVLSMDKAAIAQKFGTADRPGRSYQEMLNTAIAGIQQGGKAPERFVPTDTANQNRPEWSARLTQLVQDLCNAINTFEEQELDTLLVPHPMLGKLTLREMLYNAIYHVQRHQARTQEYLSHKTTSA